jgi:hypothetical protein|tara:strand:+ start:100 stop:315 length:216 start_codon:yes stop_codon:yes gene_type:complete
MKQLINYFVISIVTVVLITSISCGSTSQSSKIEVLPKDVPSMTQNTLPINADVSKYDTLSKPSLLLFVSSS